MSSPKKERNKDIVNFHRLCKDLFKYIKRKIFKKYVDPDLPSISQKSSNLEDEDSDYWKYYNTEEKITEEEKIYDLFKDNSFLVQVQKCYETLEIVISSLDENRKNFEYLKKNIEVGEKKIKLLSELNSQLNQYFNTSNTQIPFNQSQNNVDCLNNQNVIGHLSLVKSFNILNDLKIINSINDLNNGENINNNSDFINNINSENEHEENTNLQEDKNKNDLQNCANIPNLNFLKKKIKRDNKTEKYIKLNEQKNAINPNISNTKEDNKKVQIHEMNINNAKNKIKKEDINLIEKNSINSLIDKINVSQNQQSVEDKSIPNNSNVKENYINLGNSEQSKSKDNNINNKNNIKNTKGIKYKDSGEVEFEKILKKEFSSIYSIDKNIESNNDIIQEIKNILKKISSMTFPESKNKFENPSLIGTYKNINIMFLLDALPAIDILFKCKDIKSIEEINSISEETMNKKLNISFIEICKGYDKESEIVKVTNKCKIKVKDNYFFIYINLFFVNIIISSYNKKEQCINRYLFSNDIYINKDKVLICMFFRRWRRKFKLFFIVPEFLDIIINFYYNKNESISLIIENIFYDLFNGEINFFAKKNIAIDDEKNINEIIGFIGEWYNIPEHKTALNNAIVATNESLLKNDYLSVIKSD